jgi:hypothetical protein
MAVTEPFGSRENGPRMREVLTAPQAELLQSLFSPAERWGWEYREPDALPELFPHPRPVPYLPWPKWAAELAPKQEQAERSRAGLTIVAAVCLLVTVLIGLSSPFWSVVFLAAAGFFGYLGLARPWLLHRQSAARQRQWMEACVESHGRYRQQLESWAAARQQHERRELERLEASPEWAALRPTGRIHRLDVYGGTASGWEALITSAGASLLGSGVQLTVVDLTQDSVAAELAQLAELRGYGVDVVVLPEQMEDLDPFWGLRPDEVRDVLVEALHGDEPAATHEARSIDGRVLGELCETLSPLLTLGRICAGLRALLRDGRSPSEGDAELAPDEYRRIANLFGETARASMEPRMVALESRLHSLRRLGRWPGGRPLLSGGGGLRVLALDDRGSDLANDVLTHLLLQVLIHTARERRNPSGGEDALLVAGADVLRRRHLERLDQLARQRGIRLVYMFRHLRDEAVDLLGGGGTAIFMRLGNAREAMNAADFIGREHKFVLHQLTRSTGESLTDTFTESVTDTIGTNSSFTRTDLFRILLPIPITNSYTSGRSNSRAWGESRSTATGTTSSESPGQQRVYEFAVEPATLQALPDTALLFVDHQRRQGPRARLGDCNPDIVTLPNVSAEPFGD